MERKPQLEPTDTASGFGLQLARLILDNQFGGFLEAWPKIIDLSHAIVKVSTPDALPVCSNQEEKQ